jgi:hypothetical protein
VHLVAPTAAKVRGRVVDLAGQPVRGARIELVPRATAPRTPGLHEFRAEGGETNSTAEGGFAFETTCGWFSLSAAALGEAAAEEVIFALDPAQPEIDLQLCLPQAARLVRVRLASARAIEPSEVWVGAQGTLAWPASSDAGGRIVARTHGDLRAHGVARSGPVWELDLPQGGSWTLSAGGIGFETTRVALPAGAEELTLRSRRRPRRRRCASAATCATAPAGRCSPASPCYAPATSDTSIGPRPTPPESSRSRARTARRTSSRPTCSRAAPDTRGRARSAIARGLARRSRGRARPRALDPGRIEGLAPGARAELVLRSRAERFTSAELAPSPPGCRARWRASLPQQRDIFASTTCRGEYELCPPEDLALPPARAARARRHAGPRAEARTARAAARDSTSCPGRAHGQPSRAR